jgi:hypothetical protein
VELPPGNLDFHKVALQLSAKLPSKAGGNLEAIVRAKKYSVSPKEVGSSTDSGVKTRHWQLKMDNDWTVPAVEMFREPNMPAVLLISDRGRATLAAEAEKLLSAGHRVIAVDPFYFGESKISKRDFLFALLVSSVGDRPLGIQASQIAAIAKWANTPVSIQAFGPRSSLIAITAAALEKRSIKSVETHDELASLRDVIGQNMSADKAPELFTFGLLESFDIPQIKALGRKAVQ